MPDRYALTLKTAVASNTGGPYVTTWDQVVVPASGTARTAWAVAKSLSSNGRTNSVDIYNQSDAPSHGSNTGSSILVSPITLTDNLDVAQGTISEAGASLDAGDILQLRTYADTNGAAAAFTELTATIEIERT